MSVRSRPFLLGVLICSACSLSMVGAALAQRPPEPLQHFPLSPQDGLSYTLEPAPRTVGHPTRLGEVVPMPDPLPESFPSRDAYEAALRTRVHQLRVRELQLEGLAHPAHRGRRITLGFVAAGIGLVGASFAAQWLAYAGDSGPPPVHIRNRCLGTLGAFALGSLAGLTVAVGSLTAHRYKRERREARLERQANTHELHRVMRERGLTLQLSATSANLRLTF
jgi:hypothetical protein